MKPKEIQELLEYITNSGLEEVTIETDTLKLVTKRSNTSSVVTTPVLQHTMPSPTMAPATLPTPVSAPAPNDTPSTPSASDANLKVIKSPMIGTFYRAPGPNEDPFVNVGDTISKNETVCIIEAMKLFNEIESEYAGKIVKILVEDATPVEYDQPLFLIDPS